MRVPAWSPAASIVVRMARRRRGLLGKILLGLVLVLVVAVVAGYWYIRPLLLTGTGYAAHNACAVTFVAGRDDPAADLPPNPLVPYLRTTIDQSEGSATTSVLGVLARQTAWVSDGFGCTITARHPEHPAAVPVTGSNAIAEAATPDAVPDALAKALDAAFADGLGTRGVVVVKDGKLVAERYADGFTKDVPQLGWSMSKSVANLLTGRVAAQGKVTVGDANLRPEWTDDRAAITVEDLMRMRSGLAWDETYDLGTAITEMLYLAPDMGAFAASQKLAHPVGTFEQYSSGSTNILCDVLLDRTGSDANLPRELLFAPLGISSAVWEPDASGTPVCSSYMWATPRDWAAVGQFALDDGVVGGERLLPEGWLASSLTPTDAQTREDDDYGAGWWLNTNVDGSGVYAGLPKDAYWMSGHDGQRVFVIPSKGLVIARLGFSPGLDGDTLAQLAADVVAAVG